MLAAAAQLPRSPARDLLGVTDAGIAWDIDSAAVLKLRRVEERLELRRDERLAKMIAIQLGRYMSTPPGQSVELPDVFEPEVDAEPAATLTEEEIREFLNRGIDAANAVR